MCLWAFQVYLASHLGVAAANLIIGLIALGIAGGFAWSAMKANR